VTHRQTPSPLSRNAATKQCPSCGQVFAVTEFRQHKQVECRRILREQRRAAGNVDRRGRVLFVSDGISGGKTWGTYYRKPSGSLKRLVSKHLPLRTSRAAAEADLRLWLDGEGKK
jgi:hypothetical protein